MESIVVDEKTHSLVLLWSVIEWLCPLLLVTYGILPFAKNIKNTDSKMTQKENAVRHPRIYSGFFSGPLLTQILPIMSSKTLTNY